MQKQRKLLAYYTGDSPQMLIVKVCLKCVRCSYVAISVEQAPCEGDRGGIALLKQVGEKSLSMVAFRDLLLEVRSLGTA